MQFFRICSMSITKRWNMVELLIKQLAKAEDKLSN